MKLIYYSLMCLSVNIQMLHPAMLNTCLYSRDPVLLCSCDYTYLMTSYWDDSFLNTDTKALYPAQETLFALGYSPGQREAPFWDFKVFIILL